MSKTINLGRVTAYADAVAAGYTGTREEFAQDLANAANYAAESHQSAETASAAAETASNAATTATTAASSASDDASTAHADAEAALSFKTAAETAAGTATTKAGEAANSASQAATSASGAAGSATAASGSATAAAGSATNAAASETAAAGSATAAAGSASAAAQTLVDVNAAGATQVAAIAAKGAEVLESIPSDYTELSQDVDDLKSDLSTISDIVQATDITTLNAQIRSQAIESASYRRLVYASVGDAKSVTVHKILSNYFTIGFTNTTPANGVAVSGVITRNGATSITSAIPDGAQYVVASIYNSNSDTIPWDTVLASVEIDLLKSAKDVAARDDIDALDTRVSGYDGEIYKNRAFRTDVAKEKNSYNLFDGNLENGYITKNGTLTVEGNYKHTSKIDVHNMIGETIRVFEDTAQSYIRFVCVYDANNVVKSNLGNDTNSLTYTIPDGAYYVILSFTGSAVNSPYVLITTEADKTVYIPHLNEWTLNKYSAVDGDVNIPTPIELRATSLADGATVKGNTNAVKRLGTYVFYCKPGTMSDSGYIIFGKDTSKGYAVGISASGWAWFVNNVNQGGGNHGLTVKDYLLVVVNKVPGTGAVLTIYTNGGTYTRTNTSWLDDHGAPYVYNNSGDTITDVKMSWTSSAFRNRNWVFGDSYVTIASTRWPKYVYDLGFGDNIMINGYPGEQSEAGYKDFIDCLRYGKPSVMAWCLGMNDADSGAVNTSWLKYVTAFLDVCDLYDIEPILATIPCCPIADHQYKNAWVKASGYRYIDFANAVNVAENSTTWYDGMLADDNIHPTAQGAIALASQVLTDYPELLIK